MTDYRRRMVDDLLSELLGELPAVLLTGPRATGKTTTALGHASTVVRLDHEAEATAFIADPDAALAGLAEPVLLDEWQAVPGVLGAVKRAVDAQSRPGRFLLTGSARADLDTATWPGTGRVVRVEISPLTVAEQTGSNTSPLLDRVANGDELRPAADSPDLRGYVELALRGGFPEPALALSPQGRRRWLESYVAYITTRDALDVEAGRDPQRLARYFEAYVINSAGTPTDKTIYDAAGIDSRTARAYHRLLTNLLIFDELPAWTSNRLTRLAKTTKRFVIDASLLASVTGTATAATAAMRDGQLLGKLIETFVVAQLRAEIPVCETRARLFHMRDRQGRHEIDVIAELGARQLIGLEIKGTSAPSNDDARHLLWLRDQIGDQFLAGIVLHTGPRTFQLADNITAAPISTLWS
ncbi:MAG: DUF4143 domain-containing protein [Acidimicrobiaceae bacterium]|nr:DUF4143 domain-containing protein [Acidimicrobiaceae bacterium]